jgi:hypothetical protein
MTKPHGYPIDQWDKLSGKEKRMVAAHYARVYAFLNEVDGLDVEQYLAARDFFAKRGVDFAHVPKGWRFCRWVGRTARYSILWVGPALVREYLDAPSTLFAALDTFENRAAS